MGERINYMIEIRKMEEVIERLEELPANEINLKIKGHLIKKLQELVSIADDMSLYIHNPNSMGSYLRISKDNYFIHGDYEKAIEVFKRLQRLEYISALCYMQMPEEKMYFLEDYAKYREEKESIVKKR
ncbi:MAG: hypothetical protein WC343_04960 [Bacilli bacterium]